MSLSVSAYIGLGAIGVLVASVVVSTVRRRRRNQGDDKLLSEMATDWWNLPLPTRRPEVAGTLNPEKPRVSSAAQRPETSDDALQAAREQRETILSPVSETEGAPPIRPEAAPARPTILAVELGKEPQGSPAVEFQEPRQTPRVLARDRLLWECVGAETGVPEARSRESGPLEDSFEEARHPAITEELGEKAQKELDVAASAVLEQTRRRLHSEVFSALESFSQQVGARLHDLEQEQFSQSLAKLRAELTAQIQRQLEDTNNAAREARQQVSAVADRVTALVDNRELILLSARAHQQGQEVRQYADAALEKIDLAIQTTAGKLQTFEKRMEVSFAETVDALRKASDDLIASSARRLERQSDEAAERVSGELRALQARSVDEANKQLAATTQAPLQSLTQQAKAVTEECLSWLRRELNDGVRSSAQELEADYRKSLEKQRESIQRSLEEQLAAATQASLKSLTQQAKAVTEECLSRLRQELDERVRNGVRQLEAEHRQLLDQRGRPVNREIGLREDNVGELYRESIRLHWGSWREAAVLRTSLWIASGLAAVTLIVLFLSLSIQHVIRLRPDPPVEFLEEGQGWSPKRRVSEEHLARAYWESAVRYMQSKYAFGTELPEEPPVEFRAEGTKSDSATRSRYWRKLRQVWVRDQAWEKSYVWNTNWIDNIFASVGRAARVLADAARRKLSL